ncbi:MAG TPA: helix-turn-helix transcriptional regulator [Terriglobales bacterium]|nr:helix-turn-helix transcriptional regulator [Terriglobales bacterium]
MSQKRHIGMFDRSGDPKSAITTLARDYPHGYVIPLHFHDRDQLVYASRGVMTVRTGSGTWVVPPHRAVWIPMEIPHTITMSGLVAMRTLYLKPRLAKRLPRDCSVINVSSFLKELILHACSVRTLRKSVKWQMHLIAVILHQLEAVQTVALQLPHLSDPRLIRISDLLTKDPSDSRTLAELCRVSATSKRSIERLFQQEIGMTFGKWRQQLRLMQGMRLLAEGAKVTHAALESGYSTPSAFISMFKKALGTTPTSYFT